MHRFEAQQAKCRDLCKCTCCTLDATHVAHQNHKHTTISGNEEGGKALCSPHGKCMSQDGYVQKNQIHYMYHLANNADSDADRCMFIRF